MVCLKASTSAPNMQVHMTDAEQQLSIHESALKAMAQATGQDMYAYLYRAAQEAHRLGIISDAEWGAMRERGQGSPTVS